MPELTPDPGEVVDRGGRSRHPLEAWGPRLPKVVSRAHLIATEALEEWEFPVEEPRMRPVELVRRAEQEVGVERLHINWVVRRRADRVKHGQRTGLMGESNDLFARVDGAQCIRGHADRNDLGTRGAQCRIRINVEGGVAGADRDDLEGEAKVFGEPEPGAVVRVVIKLRDDHLVAWLQALRQRSRELEIERRHVGAEFHRLLWRIE